MTQVEGDAQPLRGGLFAVVLLLGLVFAWRGATPPVVAPARAPATAFSAERALSHLRVIAAGARLHTSAAAHAARDYLAGQLAALGYRVRIDREIGVGVSAKFHVIGAGVVENIEARLPGQDPRLPAILVMAHYDSVENAPGAGDDGAGVAAALEIARAMRAGPQPLRDVVILLTDGEESGLLGARAYFADRVRASGVGAAINMEARGTAGRPVMFQAGARSGGLVRLYLSHGGSVFAPSPSAAIYESLPNDTDLTAAIAAGVPGLNFAFVGSEVDYHAPTDNLRTIDPRSIQAMGDGALPVVRRLADMARLPEDGDAVVAGQVPGLFALSYPGWVGWLVLGGSAALLAAAAAVARVRSLGLARGAAAGLWLILLSVAALGAVRGLTGVPDAYGSNKPLLADLGGYELSFGLAGLGLATLALTLLAMPRARLWAVAASLAVGALGLLAGPDPVVIGCGVAAALVALFAFGGAREALGGWMGMIALGLVLGLVLQLLAPAATTVVSWAVAGAPAAALGMAVLGRGRGTALVLAALLALLPLAHLLLLGHLSVVTVGALLPGALAVVVFGVAMLLGPLAGAARGAVVGGGLIVLGLGLAALWPVLHGPTERTPQLTSVTYFADSSERRAMIYSPLDPVDPWTRSVLGLYGGEPRRGPIPEIGDAPVWQASAPLLPVPPGPVMTFERDGAMRTLTVSAGGAHSLGLRFDTAAPLKDVTLNGVAATALEQPGPWRIRWKTDGPPLVIRFRATAPGTLGIDAVAYQEGWPASLRPLPPRPATVARWGGTDRAAILSRARFGL